MHDDRGSVLLAVTVMVVITTILAVTVTSSMANVRRQRLDNDRRAALATAESALAEVSARIEMGETSMFRGAGTVGETSYTYVANNVSPSRYDVVVRAVSGSVDKYLRARWELSGLMWQRSNVGEAIANYPETVMMSSGLAAYWRLGEDSGPLIVDSSGNGHNATVVGGVTLNVAGALSSADDGAVEMTSPTDHIVIPDSLDFAGNAPFTVAAWFAITSPAMGLEHSLVQKRFEPGAPGTYDGWVMGATTTGPSVFGQRWSAGIAASSEGPAAIGPWTYGVMTYDGTVLRTYANNSLLFSASSPLPLSDTPQAVSIGNRCGCTIDEVAIWDRALNASEIAALIAAR
jgi:type II secretory pathway pseudopilin PulG